jgi:hypothetical protein
MSDWSAFYRLIASQHQFIYWALLLSDVQRHHASMQSRQSRVEPRRIPQKWPVVSGCFIETVYL